MFHCIFNPSIACFWGLIPGPAQIVLFICVGLIFLGFFMNVGGFFHKLGGWPAVVGAIVGLITIIGVIFYGGDNKDEEEKKNAPRGEPRTSMFPDLFKPKEKRLITVEEAAEEERVRREKRSKKRRYNPDNNTWEEP